MSIASVIEQYFEAGYKPSDLVRMGYAKSTVYMAYKRWMRKKIGENAIYIAYDVEPEVLEKFVGQLRIMGFNVHIGGATAETLDKIEYVSVFIAIAGKSPGFRRQLFYEEISTAFKLGKRAIILVEEGTVIPVTPPPNAIIIKFNRSNIRATIEKLVGVLRDLNREDPLYQLLSGIAIAFLAAMGLAALMEILGMLLEGPRES